MCDTPNILSVCLMYVYVRQTMCSCISITTKTALKYVTYFTYWPVIGSFNNWNIITLSNKDTKSEAFERIHQVVIDGISDNMALLVRYVKYGAINTTYSTTMGSYMVNFSQRPTLYRKTMHVMEN